MFSHSVSTKDIVQTVQLWANLAVSDWLDFQILVHFLDYLYLQRQWSNQENWDSTHVQLEPMSWKTECFDFWVSTFDHQRKMAHSQSFFWVMITDEGVFGESKTFLKHMVLGGERGCCIILGMMATCESAGHLSPDQNLHVWCRQGN